MSQTKSKAKKTNAYKNPLEVLGSIGSQTASNTVDSFKQIGGGVFDQLLGNDYGYDDMYDMGEHGYDRSGHGKEDDHNKKSKKEHAPLFRFAEHHETNIVASEIKKYTEIIKQELAMLQRANTSLMNEVKAAHDVALNDATEQQVGVYHVRFLELVLELIRTARTKIAESGSWMQALMSKKKKRGSLFASRTKKMGTQYSLSQELQVTRQVQ